MHDAAGKPIVNIDESGRAYGMLHTRGYVPRDQRYHGALDWNAQAKTNVIGALLAGYLLTTGLT